MTIAKKKLPAKRVRRRRPRKEPPIEVGIARALLELQRQMRVDGIFYRHIGLLHQIMQRMTWHLATHKEGKQP